MDVILETAEAGLYRVAGAFAGEGLADWVRQVDWRVNQIRLFGNLHDEPRETAWYGPAYRYSSISWPARPMPASLLAMASRIESALAAAGHGLPAGWHFNSVLLNHYRNGRDHMGWHRDNEREIDGLWIASVSLGATRDFKVRRRGEREAMVVPLAHGDLLLMRNFQEDYEHALPKRLRVEGPRLNFTFRRCLGG